jgi:hypothetical protein
MEFATAAEYAAWEQAEKRFMDLVRFGVDDRTPEHERRNACSAACRMVLDGDIDPWAISRARMVKKAFEMIQSKADELQRQMRGIR